MSEPRFGSWSWIVEQNKRDARATWFVLKRYWIGTAFGLIGLLGAQFGLIDPPALGVGAFLGWFLTAMFVAHDISLGFLEVADVGAQEGGD